MNLAPTIRLAWRSEAPLIARLSRDRIEQGLGWSWTPQRVRRSIDNAETNVAVAVAADVALGFGIMKYHAEEAHLLLLAVRQDAERAGLGTALLGWLEASARSAGIGRVTLEARAANTGARAFYRRLGYTEIRLVPGYYGGVEASVTLARNLWVEQPAQA